MFSIIADCCQFEHKNMYLYPSLDEKFRPFHFHQVSELVKEKIPKLFTNALEGAGSSSDSDTEMTDLSTDKSLLGEKSGEFAVKREKLVLLTYLSALSVYNGCTAEPHVLQFLPVLAHYANDTK